MTDLTKMSDKELAKWTSGWREGTEDHILGMEELYRRRGIPVAKRSWIAIGISVLALVLSAVALFK